MLRIPLVAAAALLLTAGFSFSASPEDAPPGDPVPGAVPSLDPAVPVRRAIGAMQAGQWKAARAAWEEVLRFDPANAAALSNLGKVLYQLKEYEPARDALEKATAANPALSDSWLTLGLVYLELKAPMMAVSATTRGVAENPADPRAHNSLAIVLKRVGWTSGAEAEMQKALDLDPEYAEAHFNLAVMYLERKPPALEMAGRHYRKARSLGTAPDEVLEAQLRGEHTVIGEVEETEPPATAPATPPATAAPRATPAAKPAPPKAAPSKKPSTTPRKKPSPA